MCGFLYGVGFVMCCFICMCWFCNVLLCVSVVFLMCCCEYKCGYFNVLLCVCLGFVMYCCVYVWDL